MQQDNCSVHNSVETQTRLAELGIESLKWPARWPYLNIIENCWSLMTQIIYDSRQYDNIDQLWATIQDSVDELNLNRRNKLQSLFDSIPKRFLEVIEKVDQHNTEKILKLIMVFPIIETKDWGLFLSVLRMRARTK